MRSFQTDMSNTAYSKVTLLHAVSSIPIMSARGFDALLRRVICVRLYIRLTEDLINPKCHGRPVNERRR